MSHARRLSLPRLPAIALALAAVHAANAAESAAPPACPVGVLVCPQPAHANLFAMCRRNALLDAYTPGLPTQGDRTQVAADVSARKVVSTDSSHYRLEDDVRMQRLDQLLRSDFLTYDTDTTAYSAGGHVIMQDRSMLMTAASASGTDSPRTTHLKDVRYQLLQQRGNGSAASADMSDADHGRLFDGTYSTCDPDDVRWHLHAGELDTDKVADRGYAHGVTVYYADVPFFWFPYLSFPLSNDRQSGFLAPHIAYSSHRGLVLGAPYYLNLAPNYDATLEPRVSTERGAMLQGQFRYLDAADKAQLDFNFVPHDNQAADERAQYAATPPVFQGPASPVDVPDQRYAFRIKDWSRISDNWGAAVDIERVSDKQYFQDYGDSLTTSATALLGSSAYLNGRGTWWNASFGADALQITQTTLSNAAQPYMRLPRATFQGEHALAGGLVWGVNSEYVDFRRGPFELVGSTPGSVQSQASLEGQRVDLYPYLAYPIETAGYFIRPELGLRYTAYELNDLAAYNTAQPGTPAFSQTSPSRSTPIFDLDAGMVFERPLTLFGTALTQTLEPRLYYLRVPYRNQADLPLFDTQLPSFDFPSLFRSNSFVGADRQSNADNLTLALTSRLIDAGNGDELLSASIGQIHYFSPQRVQLPGVPEVDYSGSDIVGELDLRLNDNWELKWDQQYNPNSRILDPQTQMLVENLHPTDLSAISVEHRFGAEGTVNFSYRFRRGLLEQVDTSALFPLNANWSLVGRYYYSLLHNQLLEAFAGAQYDSCCVAMRVLVRRYINVIGQLKPSNGVYFELEFKGLGSTGTRTENFLRRAILGYQ
ncbi:MAG: LPS assembly protein LptD [Xanthomonadaceae bacterium]|nr:LPS assembly protein LptD [Xanthomonadaceae bacterium]